ncbi:TIGR02391 family protein [Nocardia ignorata]|uniref:TIGR02391 family protein n=1 Tax=Nocardia ignorata TaxID=145285 RepID=UPI00362FAF59
MFTLVRTHDDGSTVEREIQVHRVTSDSLRVKLDEDVRVGDVIEDRLREDLVKRMQILDVIPERSAGILAAWNDHLDLRYEVRTKAEIAPPKHFETSSLHPVIAEIARDRLTAGNGNDAVFRAFEAIETRVQKLTGRTDIGDTLMTRVFQHKPNPPQLDIADHALDVERRDYERNGYKFLFMGAVLGIRNTHAHGSRPEVSPVETIELLAFASHLMRRLDLAEDRLGT